MDFALKGAVLELYPDDAGNRSQREGDCVIFSLELRRKGSGEIMCCLDASAAVMGRRYDVDAFRTKNFNFFRLFPHNRFALPSAGFR